MPAAAACLRRLLPRTHPGCRWCRLPLLLLPLLQVDDDDGHALQHAHAQRHVLQILLDLVQVEPRLTCGAVWARCARAPGVRACVRRACVRATCVQRACVQRACVRACSVRACGVRVYVRVSSGLLRPLVPPREPRASECKLCHNERVSCPCVVPNVAGTSITRTGTHRRL